MPQQGGFLGARIARRRAAQMRCGIGSFTAWILPRGAGGGGFVYNPPMAFMQAFGKTAARGWRREAWIALLWLAVGALLLPLLIYLCGITFLGTYAGAGLGLSFRTVLGGLAAGSPASWVVVAGPYLMIQLLRVLRLWWRVGSAART